MKRYVLFLVSAAAALAVTAAACSTEDGGSQPTPSSTPDNGTATATATPQAATATATPEEMEPTPTPLYRPPNTLTPNPNEDQLRMVSNRNRWEVGDFHIYEFDFQWTCWCFFASNDLVRIRVYNGEITSITDPVTGEPIPEPDYEQNEYRTIDELFDWIQHQIDIPADELSVEYADDFSYPVSADSDPDPNTVDDERSFRITNFHPYPDGVDLDEVRAQLDTAREKWSEAGFRDYTFEFRWECRFCHIGDTKCVKVEVREGAVASVTDAETGEPPEIPGRLGHHTVEGLFAWIDSQIEQGLEFIVLEFDPEIGFPMMVQVDLIGNPAFGRVAFFAYELEETDIHSQT